MNAPSPPTSSWKKPTQRALAVALAAVVALLACSRQGEGDRCSTENDNNDCESGLICVAAKDLRSEQNDGVSRCCRPEGEGVGDGRCTRLIGGNGGTGGSDNTGGQAGEANGDSTTTSGQSCTHNSQCAVGMVCGPQGVCQAECLDDRDCDAPLICSQGRCVRR